MKLTVDYLLKNSIGIKNATSTDKIIRHLNSLGYNISKETWQINVLGPLRDNGIFIASKPSKGMFLIETEQDASESVKSMEHRIDVEENRLKILRGIASNAGWNV